MKRLVCLTYYLFMLSLNRSKKKRLVNEYLLEIRQKTYNIMFVLFINNKYKCILNKIKINIVNLCWC